MTTTDSVLRLARLYAAHRGIALSTVGRIVMGHGNFFDRLRAGRVTIARADRAMHDLSNHWLDGLEWPADIPRPEPRPEGERGEAA